MSLNVRRTVAEFRAATAGARARGERIGLVPTMGALHAGHMALVDAARAHGTSVALTLFVNPTQFGPNEDLARYPRPFEADVELCRRHGVSELFAPSVAEMYPPGERTRVLVSGLTEVLCGPKRPNHFEGVATIVAKLFNAAGPCTAFFGRKDYQQLQVIRRMANDLLLPVEVIGHPTIRESDGLALSSRNAYLSPEERLRAPTIARALARAAQAFDRGETRALELRTGVEKALVDAGFRVDYVELVTADDLVPIADRDALPARALLAVAAFLGKTRLIDNLVLGEERAIAEPLA